MQRDTYIGSNFGKRMTTSLITELYSGHILTINYGGKERARIQDCSYYGNPRSAGLEGVIEDDISGNF